MTKKSDPRIKDLADNIKNLSAGYSLSEIMRAVGIIANGDLGAKVSRPPVKKAVRQEDECNT